jgi:L-asparaginase / beta-aspartyl-peptidase
MSPPVDWALAVHGGAKEVKPEAADANRRGCLSALTAGESVLKAGGTAMHAVEACVRSLENDATFNAGYGSVLNSDGDVEMDAAVMDGKTLDVGAVAAIVGVRNPVVVAHAMLRERPILLVGSGAKTFAEEVGAELCDPQAMIAASRTPVVPEHDTVGCVALDSDGNIAVATSTGGLPGKRPGRVGDTPLPGCGFYATNGVGGVVFTGEGELIARLALASNVMELLRNGEATARATNDAVAHAILRLAELGGDGGALAIDRDGNIGWSHNTSHFAVALVTSRREPAVFLRKSDEDRQATDVE